LLSAPPPPYVGEPLIIAAIWYTGSPPKLANDTPKAPQKIFDGAASQMLQLRQKSKQ